MDNTASPGQTGDNTTHGETVVSPPVSDSLGAGAQSTTTPAPVPSIVEQDNTPHDEPAVSPLVSDSTGAGADAQSTTTPAAVPSTAEEKSQKPQPQHEDEDDDDDDDDLDELDDVLDDFSKPKPEASSTPATPSKQPALQPAPSTGPTEGFDEASFMKLLEQDMASMMGQAAQESGAPDNAAFEDTINQGADAFVKQLEESGIPPGDFLQQLLSGVMEGEGEGQASAAGAGVAAAAGLGSLAGGKTGAQSGAETPTPESFNDAIQNTMNRMKESSNKATAASTEDDMAAANDMLAQLMKLVEESGGVDGDSDPNMEKLVMNMMEKLASKEMLYGPMKELDAKFWPYIRENEGKLSEEDTARYKVMAQCVTDIVAKFEEEGYDDSDPKSREYISDKMTQMQDQGTPPTEVFDNPLLPGADGEPSACPQQ